MNGFVAGSLPNPNSSRNIDSTTRHINPGNHFWSYESLKRYDESSTNSAAFTWTPPVESDASLEPHGVQYATTEIPYFEMQRGNHWANHNFGNSHILSDLPNTPHHVTGQSANFSHWNPNYPMSGSIQQPTENQERSFMEAQMQYGRFPNNTPYQPMPPSFQGAPQWSMQNGYPTERNVNDSNGMYHPGFSLNHGYIARQLVQDFRVPMSPEEDNEPQSAPTLASNHHMNDSLTWRKTKKTNERLPKKQLPTPDTTNTKSEYEQIVLAMDIFVTDPARYNNWCPPRLDKVLKSYLAGFVVLPYDLRMPRREAVIAINGRIKSRIGKYVEPDLLRKLMISLRKRFHKSKVSTDDSE